MTMLSPFLSINCSCEEVLHRSKTKLSEAGLTPVQTFDLSNARLGSHNCTCPNHGTEACDCQMVVLLVYGEFPEPATLILHGNDGKTWVSITDNAIHRVDGKFMTTIRNLFESLVTIHV